MLDPEYFLFDFPLYTKIKINDENKDQFLNLMANVKQVDGYSIYLKENTSYKLTINKAQFQNFDVAFFEGVSIITLKCLRTSEHMYFYVLLEFTDNEEDENDDNKEYFFQKIGQFPSIADLHISKIRQYDKVIDRRYIKELTRAIGLAANGVGIGSFVYLRRVFEFLLSEAHALASKNPNWEEAAYKNTKVVEKISLLSEYLPEFLVQNKSIYSILSVGIHSLDEQDCLKYFPALKLAIEMILDEKLDKLKREKKIEDAKREIALIASRIKKTE